MVFRKILFFLTLAIIIGCIGVMLAYDPIALKTMYKSTFDWFTAAVELLYLFAFYSYAFDKKYFTKPMLYVLIILIPVVGIIPEVLELRDLWSYMSSMYIFNSIMLMTIIYGGVAYILMKLLHTDKTSNI